MAERYVIRSATMDDVTELTDLEARTFAYSRISRRNFRRLIRSSTVQLSVIRDEQSQPKQPLVAYSITLSRKNSQYWRIYSIAVDANYHGQGIARALLEQIIIEAKKAQKSGLTLEVKSDNQRAIKLYQHYGFEAVDLLPDYYDDGTDGLKMRVTFDQESR